MFEQYTPFAIFALFIFVGWLLVFLPKLYDIWKTINQPQKQTINMKLRWTSQIVIHKKKSSGIKKIKVIWTQRTWE